MKFHMDLLNSQKENKIRKIYTQTFNFLREERKEKLWSGTWKYMKEAGKQFPGEGPKKPGPEYSNSHIPSPKPALQARPRSALREMWTMASPQGFVLGPAPFNILINYKNKRGGRWAISGEAPWQNLLKIIARTWRDLLEEILVGFRYIKWWTSRSKGQSTTPRPYEGAPLKPFLSLKPAITKYVGSSG